MEADQVFSDAQELTDRRTCVQQSLLAKFTASWLRTEVGLAGAAHLTKLLQLLLQPAL